MKQSNKELILLVIIISFLIAIIVIQNTSAEEVSISIGNLAADPGGTCTAQVMLKSIKDYGTGAVMLQYDPSIVHVTDVTGSEDSTVVAWNADNEIGEAKIAAWNINGVSGDIDFATITFRAADKSGSTPLTIRVDELITMYQDGIQNNIDAKVINGEFTIGANSNPGFQENGK
ncbi:MAG: hypothetical protein E4G94_01010 [ANME-2 cluster archaeon]|nr:MAG: hypothetical protein E4G94_01010 [ANME-2 cluster archaeon]